MVEPLVCLLLVNVSLDSPELSQDTVSYSWRPDVAQMTVQSYSPTERGSGEPVPGFNAVGW
jgi:hypothetical protein